MGVGGGRKETEVGKCPGDQMVGGVGCTTAEEVDSGGKEWGEFKE